MTQSFKNIFKNSSDILRHDVAHYVVHHAVDLIVIMLTFSIVNITCLAQTFEVNKFTFEATAYTAETSKSELLNNSQVENARIDFLVSLPYRSLLFTKYNDKFASKFKITYTLRDSSEKLLATFTKDKAIIEENYGATQSATGEAHYAKYSFQGNFSGKIFAEVIVRDEYSQRDFSSHRVLYVPNFKNTSISLSGILLASSIQKNEIARVEQFTITPHISDNVTPLLEHGFFAVFEVNNKLKADSVDYIYELRTTSNQILQTSRRFHRLISEGRSQRYLNISPTEPFPSDTSILRILLLKKSVSDSGYYPNEIIASSQRTIVFEKTSGMVAMNENELRKAIRQLRYVATFDEIDAIERGATFQERKKLFADFWKQLDPTPQTALNEAFEEYYSRIDYANRNYTSYSEGWLTDMGMVYIIYGRPTSIDRQNSVGFSRRAEVWNYGNGRRFVFVDNSSFGDFRLTTPIGSDKYRY